MDTHEPLEVLAKVPWPITKEEFEKYSSKIAYDIIDERKDYFYEASEEEKMGLNLFDFVKQTIEQDYPGFNTDDPKTIINSGINFDMWIDSDGDFYNQVLGPANEAMQKMGYDDTYLRGEDIITAYNAGYLPDNIDNTPESKLEINPVEGEFPKSPFGKPEYSKTPEEIRQIWAIASMRKTKNNTEEVNRARYEIFVQYNTREDLEEILDLTKSQIGKKLRNWTLYTQGARRMHQSLNSGVDPESQWFGLVNSNFVSTAQISMEDMDGFFKDIKYSKKSGFGDNAASLHLKRNILQTVMAIDTEIDYTDLSFDIQTMKDAGGRFFSQKNLIVISNNTRKTVAHEIGHYLDRKFKNELGTHAVFLSEENSRVFNAEGRKPEEERWIRRYLEFVDDLEKVASSRGSYLGSRIEIFARFISYFVNWVSETSGVKNQSYRSYHHIERRDYFNDNHCRRFVRLLQEKSYLDKIRQESSSRRMKKTASFPQPESLGEDIVGRSIPDWRGAVALHAAGSKRAKDIAENGYKAWSNGYYGKAVSFSTDLDYIRQFGSNDYENEEFDEYRQLITMAKIREDARILNQNDPDDWDVYTGIAGMISGDNFADSIMAAGYDGLYDPGVGDLFIFNADAVEYIGLYNEPKKDKRKHWYKKARLYMDEDEVADIIERANLEGMCGSGSAAIAINKFFFEGMGQYVASIITSPSDEKGIVHIAVQYGKNLFDAEGITTPTDIIDWAYGLAERPEDIDVELAVLSEQEILEGSRNFTHPDTFIKKLKEAAS